MRRLMLPGTRLSLITALAGFTIAPAQAAVACDEDALPWRKSFASGATFEACLAVDPVHGLEVRNLHYQAPGDTLRPILQRLNAAHLQVHWMDEPAPFSMMSHEHDVFDGIQVFGADNCPGERLAPPAQPEVLCIETLAPAMMKKYGAAPSLSEQAIRIVSRLHRGALQWSSTLILQESGLLRPRLEISGSAQRLIREQDQGTRLGDSDLYLAHATLLGSWRIEIGFEDRTAVTVQSMDYVLDEGLRDGLGGRRPMRARTLAQESFEQADAERFVGWHIFDAQRRGLYLDPQNNGFRYQAQRSRWPGYDLALSLTRSCERYAANNRQLSGNEACGDSLDDYINGESLSNRAISLWFSQAQLLQLRVEDWPLIQVQALEFDLLPFDWTPRSPFPLEGE